MSRLPVRYQDANSLLPREIREIPFRGPVADCLGLFGLLVLALGLTCLLSGDPMSKQYSGPGPMSVKEASYLQLLAFFLLGTGQLIFLRRRLPFLLRKRVRLFSREGWYYIGMLSALLFVLLILFYLFIDSGHMSMAGVSLCAFLFPFTAANAWEKFWDGGAGAAEKKRIPGREVIFCGVTLLLLAGLMSLTGRPAAVARPDSEPLSGKAPGKEAGYVEAGLALNLNTRHLLELDARFSSLAKDSLTSPAGLARIRGEIKAQEYALKHLLDSLDSRWKELSPMTSSFRSLLDGHRILSGFQTGQLQDHAEKLLTDSLRDLSRLP
jgi:hypothetical protein